MKLFVVYKHTSPNGKVYIGITSQNPIERWRGGKGYKTNPHFWNAIVKYGWDNFKHEILFTDLTKEEAEQKEIELIAFYKSNCSEFGYNISSGGHLQRVGFKIDKKTRLKISKSLKGKCTGNKNPMYGRCGARNPFYGKHHTDETKQKLRVANTGKYKSDDLKNKLSKLYSGVNNPNYGKHHTNEAKLKISQAVTNSWNEDKRNKLVERNKQGTKRVSCFTLQGDFIENYSSVKAAAESVNISASGISACLKGKQKSAGKYLWRYCVNG